MVLVDEIRAYHYHASGYPYWCHMATDDHTDSGLEELHAMAAAIGVPPRAFQNHPRHPHYDLPPHKRELAIALGATPVSSRELVMRCNRPWPEDDGR
jgi:hypothetical protein